MSYLLAVIFFCAKHWWAGLVFAGVFGCLRWLLSSLVVA